VPWRRCSTAASAGRAASIGIAAAHIGISPFPNPDRFIDMSEEREANVYESPIGPLAITVDGDGRLRGIRFPNEEARPGEGGPGPTGPVTTQLREYFDGRRERFDLAVELTGTPLQLAVWARLRRIPYGETVSYGELTGDLDPQVFPADLEPYQRVRAVGTEIGRTPVPIVIPCHRVIGADGSLTGYGGGLHRKRALLDLEQGVAQMLPLA
jgi:methylated-DNA-[protein]-cysteine S-methyltransferase